MILSEKDMKKAFFKEYTFHVSKDVYEPAEDTFLLAENLVVDKNDVVLDVGTGCGILGILAAKKARRVVAVDVNPHAVCCAKMNAELNGVAEKIETLRSDLFKAIKKNVKFDLIIFNAPYLPSEMREEKNWIERAWAGGPTGRQLIDQFILQAPSYLKKGGKILLVQSTLSDVEETVQKLRERQFCVRVLAQDKVAFETIVVIEATL
jgi:release factor glutamine methyltransferase